MEKEKKTKIELLAPAKNLDSGKTAILSGADAVYIGPQKFGARAKAGNSLRDIAALIGFARQYGANVYATVNTLLFDDEISEAVSLIHHLHHIGISGVIIQDMGLLECDLPPVPVIASTQCFANTPEKVRFFQDLGFKRVILPRELSLKQIRQIRAEARKVELEFFIHGALCVSYSGQCYLSYALGGRSGNRGVCAQPCRKLYSLFDSSGNLIQKEKHLLSLKDLNLSLHLAELLDAGITSFKIEGRLKDDNYIKNIVSYYRTNLDKILTQKNLSRTSSGKSAITFEPDPNKTFNRGYSDYFFTGEQNKIASIDTPKMQGELIGKILQAGDHYFVLDTPVRLANGDGISFYAQSKLTGTKINQVEGPRIFPDSMHHLSRGTEIFRNFDHAFDKVVVNSKTERRIDVEFKFFQAGNTYQLLAIDEDGNQALREFSNLPTAENPEQNQQVIRESLAKTGKTIFNCTHIDLKFTETPFLKKSEINRLRRDLLNDLLESRIQNRTVTQSTLVKNDQPWMTENLDYRGNVINQKAVAFYRRHGVKEIRFGAELTKDLAGKTVMTTRYCLRKELGRCLRETARGEKPDWILKDPEGHEFLLKFHCDVCEMEVIAALK
ncbi:MAG: U32 family peptidase [Candidatus Marinimicrobia bacterium]|nr:U32 family peptidase [Candidatus Neomarinimicrobiota bacterium]